MNICTRHCKQAESYGAIAYGPTSGRWGTAYQWGSRSAAERAAIKNCAAKDCKALVWFESQCGAVAADQVTGDYGYDHGGSRNTAEAGALRYCTRQGGKNCKPVAWACSQ